MAAVVRFPPVFDELGDYRGVVLHHLNGGGLPSRHGHAYTFLRRLKPVLEDVNSFA